MPNLDESVYRKAVLDMLNRPSSASTVAYAVRTRQGVAVFEGSIQRTLKSGGAGGAVLSCHLPLPTGKVACLAFDRMLNAMRLAHPGRDCEIELDDGLFEGLLIGEALTQVTSLLTMRMSLVESPLRHIRLAANAFVRPGPQGGVLVSALPDDSLQSLNHGR